MLATPDANVLSACRTLFGADEVSPALMLSKFWLYLAMPVGCALAAANTLVLALQNGEAREATAA